jgi:hypothetical protein
MLGPKPYADILSDCQVINILLEKYITVICSLYKKNFYL